MYADFQRHVLGNQSKADRLSDLSEGKAVSSEFDGDHIFSDDSGEAAAYTKKASQMKTSLQKRTRNTIRGLKIGSWLVIVLSVFSIVSLLALILLVILWLCSTITNRCAF